MRMKRLTIFLIFLWPTLAYSGEFVGQFGPVLPWKRDHQQTTSYRSWAGEVSYRTDWTDWLKAGVAIQGMWFRFPDTSSGYVVGVGPVLVPHLKLSEHWSIEAPFGASLALTDLRKECVEISAQWNALLHVGVALRYKSFITEIRWQHLSNAGSRAPNIGLDTFVPMVGFIF